MNSLLSFLLLLLCVSVVFLSRFLVFCCDYFLHYTVHLLVVVFYWYHTLSTHRSKDTDALALQYRL